jgi:hypothetical protein
MEASDAATWSASAMTASIEGRAAIIGRSSSATAASTAAISSGSAGQRDELLRALADGVGRLARVRATPQATTLTWMRSASQAAIRPAMSRS